MADQGKEKLCDRDDVLLPVTVRCRRADVEDWLPASAVPQDLGAVLAPGRLVVEVRLLPPLAPPGS